MGEVVGVVGVVAGGVVVVIVVTGGVVVVVVVLAVGALEDVTERIRV